MRKLIAKSKSDGVSVIKMLYGIGIGLAVTFAVALIGTICINNEYLDIERRNMVSNISRGLGSFSGCIYVLFTSAKRKYLTAILTGVAYIVTLLLVGMLIMGGVNGGILYGIVSCLIGEICAIVLCKPTFMKGRSRRMSIRNG